MFKSLFLFAFLVSYQKVIAQTLEHRDIALAHVPVHRAPQAVRYVDTVEPPKPYSYSYESPAVGGSSSQQEVSDGSGQVRGSYSLSDEDGRSRVVEYYADETGFHANVRTNEPGTANQNPADVQVESNAPTYHHDAPVARVAPAVAPTVYATRPRPVYNRVRPVETLPINYNVLPNSHHYYPDDSHYYDRHHYHPNYYYGHGRRGHSPYYY